jgi:hypothetical protein
MLTRYIRAFIGALGMTLRGESVPVPKYSALRQWMEQAALLVDEVYSAADIVEMNRDTRQALKLTLDGRSISMETILATIRHHMREEYPYLLRHETQHNLTAIYASNMNDRYWAAKLLGAVESEVLKQAIGELSAHLDNIPPSNTI